MEDIVHAEIENVCAEMLKNPVYQGLCTCAQCRMDVACYVLNRVQPRYFVSSRGLEREGIFSFEKQQNGADLIALIFEAFDKVTHNRRPNHNHENAGESSTVQTMPEHPVFNIPAIIGRVLNGQNFAPMAEISVGLYYEGKLLKMNNKNWQNPCFLNSKTEGTFTFWPDSLPADTVDESHVFEFLLQADAHGFEPLHHIFEVPVVSEHIFADTLSMERTLKLPSLYMFPPEIEP